MRAATIRDGEVLVEEHADPAPGTGEVLVRVRAAGLNSGERLLVHGGAGGVGTAAVQIGRALGARVTATVRREEQRDAVAAFGARVIADEGFAEAGPFDVILELVGAPNMPDNLNAL